MRTLTIEAHQYFKNMYAPYIVFYRVENDYLTFYEDAKAVASLLKIPLTNGIAKISECDIYQVVSDLSKFGKSCKLVTYRNDAGQYDIPDVSILKSDENQDY